MPQNCPKWASTAYHGKVWWRSLDPLRASSDRQRWRISLRDPVPVADARPFPRFPWSVRQLWRRKMVDISVEGFEEKYLWKQQLTLRNCPKPAAIDKLWLQWNKENENKKYFFGIVHFGELNEIWFLLSFSSSLKGRKGFFHEAIIIFHWSKASK